MTSNAYMQQTYMGVSLQQLKDAGGNHSYVMLYSIP